MISRNHQKTSILYFSTNNPTLGSEFVRCSLEEFISKTQHHPHRAVVIADTIKCRSFEEIDRKKPEKAYKKCLELGDTILAHINGFCQERRLKIPVFRWDDLINDPQYRYYYEQATRQLMVRPDLSEMLENLARDFLNKRDPTRVWRPNDIKVSVDFFVQEIASFRRVNFKNVEIDQVFYVPQNMRIGEVTYATLKEVGDGLTGMGEPVPHELIRVQCINQE